MSIKNEMERRKLERETLAFEEATGRAQRLERLEQQATRLKFYQSSREIELGELGVVTRAEHASMHFDYKHVTVVVDPGVEAFTVYATKERQGMPGKETFPGSKKTISDPTELDGYLGEVFDRVDSGKM